MAFVAEGSQAFLSGNDDDDENNLAALDSMTTGSAFMSQQMQMPSGGGGMTAPTTEGGELGESLFDRIRRRTEEQQRQQKQQQQQPTAQPPSAFVSQQPSAESSMELGLEREPADGIIPAAPPTTNTGNAFDAAVKSVEDGSNGNNNNTTAEENTYSFTASTGEDFSFQPTAAPAVPTYGPSRNDPAYYSGSNSQQYPASFQEKAAMALNDAGSTIQSLFGKGMAGASTLVSSAQERMGGGDTGGRGGYNNSFLLREDSMEQGIGSNNTMQQPPPAPAASQMSQSEAVAGSSNAVSGQAYSMIAYAKTFCEDLYGFFMQLPPVGKAGVMVVLLALWLLMRG